MRTRKLIIAMLAGIVGLEGCSDGDSKGSDTADGTDAEGDAGPEPFVPDFPEDDIALYSPHPELVLELSRTSALVLAKAGTAEADVDAAIVAAGARVAGKKSDYRIWLAEVDDPGDHTAIDAVIATLEVSPVVEAVSHSALLYGLVSPGTSQGPDGKDFWVYHGIVDSRATRLVDDANWWLEAARVPAAWNLTDYIRKERSAAGTPPVTAIVVDGFKQGDVSGDVPVVQWEGLSFPPGASDTPHGTWVSSIIAANHRGGGIDGVVPAAIRLLALPPSFSSKDGYLTDFSRGELPVFSTRTLIDRLGDALQDFAPVHVVNISLGYNFAGQVDYGALTPDKCGTPGWTPIDPYTHPRADAIRREVVAQGSEFGSLIETARSLSPGLIVTPAAGNDGGYIAYYRSKGCTYPKDYFAPELMSPFNAAAMIIGTPGILVIGSHEPDGAGGLRVAGHSDEPADLHAGGTAVGVLSGQGGARATGTSMAAPVVAGIVAFLRLLEPDPALSFSTIVSVLTEGLSPLPTTGTLDLRAVDAFAAAMALDDHMGFEKLQIALADLDDGTRDGNTRIDLGDDDSEGAARFEDEHGDGTVDMRDFRRLRDAWQFVFNEGENLNGLQPEGFGLHPKMDLNGDTVFTTRPAADALEPPGAPVYREENVWSRFDLNGDGVLDPDLAIFPFDGGGNKTDLEVLAEVWNQRQLAGPHNPKNREPDDEGWDELDNVAMFRRLLVSADVDVRLGPMLADQDFANAPEIEVHVWRGDDDEPENLTVSQVLNRFNEARARRLKRADVADGKADPALVFTVPLDPSRPGGSDIHVKAYYVVDPNDPDSLQAAERTPRQGETAGPQEHVFSGVLPCEDHAVSFGPIPKDPLERYVWMYVNALSFDIRIWLETPDGETEPQDLLDGIQEVQFGIPTKIPDGMTCSARGEHVAFRIGDKFYYFTADNKRYEVSLSNPPKEGAPVLSDDRQSLIWVAGGEGEKEVVVRDLESGDERRHDLGDFAASGLRLALSPDGTKLLLTDSALFIQTGPVLLPPGAVTGPHQHILDLAGGELTVLYDRLLEAEGMQARVQPRDATFMPSGEEVFFASDEALLEEGKKRLDDPSYDLDPDVWIELYRMTPGQSPVPVTRASKETAGATKLVPAVSPDGSQVLYWTADSDSTARLRLLNIGSDTATTVKELAAGLAGPALTVGVCWLRD